MNKAIPSQLNSLNSNQSFKMFEMITSAPLTDVLSDQYFTNLYSFFKKGDEIIVHIEGEKLTRVHLIIMDIQTEPRKVVTDVVSKTTHVVKEVEEPVPDKGKK